MPDRPITLLITGFGPFPGAPLNPTELLLARLARRRRPALMRVRAIHHVFPTSYAAVDAQLPALLKQHHPDAILMFGLAARTKDIRIEMQARNRRAQAFPDIDGAASTRGTIKSGAHTLHGRAPFTRLLAAAHAAGLRARLSRDAGSYLCNYVYWRALEAARPDGPGVIAFVHVPRLRTRSRRTGRSSAPTIDQLTRAAQAIVLATATATATASRRCS
jgi:pyroglutamyl-peptidase